MFLILRIDTDYPVPLRKIRNMYATVYRTTTFIKAF